MLAAADVGTRQQQAASICSHRQVTQRQLILQYQLPQDDRC